MKIHKDVRVAKDGSHCAQYDGKISFFQEWAAAITLGEEEILKDSAVHLAL